MTEAKDGGAMPQAKQNEIKMKIKNTAMYNPESLSYIDVSEITDFSDLLAGCNIKNLNVLSTWNVSNGTNFSGMFSDCPYIESLDGLENWDMSEALELSEMFFGCRKLHSLLPLSKWNTSKCMFFCSTFSRCGFKNLNGLENWKVCGILEEMFEGNIDLESIEALKNWNFYENYAGRSLEEYHINRITFFNTNYLNSNYILVLSKMFYRCFELKTLKGLEKWDVSGCKAFDEMFRGCKQIDSLEPLKYWNVCDGEYFSKMFLECKKIDSIKWVNNWDMSNCKSICSIFDSNELENELSYKTSYINR